MVAPAFPVGLFVFVDFMKCPILESLYLLLHLIFHFCKKFHPVFRNLISVTSVNCILLYLVRLYVSFPTDTLR